MAEQKESRIEEGHLMPDHVHMLISIPPKYAVSQVIGLIKGKSAIHLACTGSAKKLRGAAFLGARIPGVHGRSRRKRGPRIHPHAGSRRQAIGPT